jgi:uncharacterized protein YceK
MEYIYKIVFTVILFSVFINGCCTVTQGTTQKLAFNSQPEGAMVEYNGRQLGKTPLSIDVNRKITTIDPKFSFVMEGFETQTQPVIVKGCGCLWGNIVVGGLLGILVDSVSGANVAYTQDSYSALLLPKGQAANQNKNDMVKQYIVTNIGYIKQNTDDGKGPHLDSLLMLLNIKDADKERAKNKIKVLMDENDNVFSTATKITESFQI